MKRTKSYLALRDKVMKRDNYKCVVCDKGPRYLNLAHILPEEFKQFNEDMDNLVMLCPEHHKLGNDSCHKNPLWFSRWLRIHRNSQYQIAIRRLQEDDL